MWSAMSLYIGLESAEELPRNIINNRRTDRAGSQKETCGNFETPPAINITNWMLKPGGQERVYGSGGCGKSQRRLQHPWRNL